MNPVSESVIELRLVVERAEHRAAGTPAFDHSKPLASLEDLRTETVADLMDAMDRLDTGLGTRLMLALYPQTDAQYAASVAGERS